MSWREKDGLAGQKYSWTEPQKVPRSAADALSQKRQNAAHEEMRAGRQWDYRPALLVSGKPPIVLVTGLASSGYNTTEGYTGSQYTDIAWANPLDHSVEVAATILAHWEFVSHSCEMYDRNVNGVLAYTKNQITYYVEWIDLNGSKLSDRMIYYFGNQRYADHIGFGRGLGYSGLNQSVTDDLEASEIAIPAGTCGVRMRTDIQIASGDANQISFMRWDDEMTLVLRNE